MTIQWDEPESIAVKTAQPSRKRFIEILGDHQPLEVLPLLLDELCGRIEGLSDDALRTPEREGQWSIAQIIQHLADTELVYGYRYRMVLSHDTPELQEFDPDLWALGMSYDKCDLEEALEMLRAVRACNLRLLRNASEEHLHRFGLEAERYPRSIRTMMKQQAAHDLVHLRQIDRILGRQ